MSKQYIIKSKLIDWYYLLLTILSIGALYIFIKHGNYSILIASIILAIISVSGTVIKIIINNENLSFTKAKIFGLLIYNRTEIKTNKIGVFRITGNRHWDVLEIFEGNKKYSMTTFLPYSEKKKLIEALNEVNPEITIIK
ncbi:MAG: hypothetical protein H6586_02175 [Flavobacteriales bacterium]|nr:hypothetical protein [Flavobacteriales bacterium]